MDLSGPSRNIDTRGSTANRSLSSALAWAASYNCYSKVWVSRAGCSRFHFSYPPVLIIGSTAESLVGCSGGQLPGTGQVADHLMVGRGHGFHRM